MKWRGGVARVGERSSVYRVGKGGGKTPMGRNGRKWEDNIKTYLQGV